MGSQAITDMFLKHLLENANLHYGEFMRDLSRLIVSSFVHSYYIEFKILKWLSYSKNQKVLLLTGNCIKLHNEKLWCIFKITIGSFFCFGYSFASVFQFCIGFTVLHNFYSFSSVLHQFCSFSKVLCEIEYVNQL